MFFFVIFGIKANTNIEIKPSKTDVYILIFILDINKSGNLEIFSSPKVMGFNEAPYLLISGFLTIRKRTNQKEKKCPNTQRHSQI